MVSQPRRVTFKGQDGVAVPIEESTERWSEVGLDDGSTRRIKPVVTPVIRLENKYDVDGSRVYVVQSTNILAVDAPPPKDLRARADVVRTRSVTCTYAADPLGRQFPLRIDLHRYGQIHV